MEKQKQLNQDEIKAIIKGVLEKYKQNLDQMGIHTYPNAVIGQLRAQLEGRCDLNFVQDGKDIRSMIEKYIN